MWETLNSIVDRVCSTTQSLLATLRTQNQPQEESCVSLGVEHSFQSVGCARNKRQCLTSLQNRKFVQLDAGLRMDGLLALDLWDVVTEVLRSWNSTKTPTNPGSSKLFAGTEMLINC